MIRRLGKGEKGGNNIRFEPGKRNVILHEIMHILGVWQDAVGVVAIVSFFFLFFFFLTRIFI